MKKIYQFIKHLWDTSDWEDLTIVGIFFTPMIIPFIVLIFSAHLALYTAIGSLCLYGLVLASVMVFLGITDLIDDYRLFETDDERIISRLKGKFVKPKNPTTP